MLQYLLFSEEKIRKEWSQAQFHLISTKNNVAWKKTKKSVYLFFFIDNESNSCE